MDKRLWKEIESNCKESLSIEIGFGISSGVWFLKG